MAGIGQFGACLLSFGSIAFAASPASGPVGQLAGLVDDADPIGIRSAAALVYDLKERKWLIAKNPDAVLPIASLTKLMTAIVVLDSRQALEERIEVTSEDIDREKNSRSRLPVGSVATRKELLQLALMSSENRASSAIARAYPGGKVAFVRAMNEKAQALGLKSAQFADPSGLSPQNAASAYDMFRLTQIANQYPLIRQFSIAESLSVDTGRRVIHYANSNRLTKSDAWTVRLQKTGFTNEAGSCMVLMGTVEGRSLAIVLLGSVGRATKFGDAHRIRLWLAGK